MQKSELLRSIEWHDVPVEDLTLGEHGVSLVVTPFDRNIDGYRSLRLVIFRPDRVQFSAGTLRSADLSRIEVSSFTFDEGPDDRLSGKLTILPGGAGVWSLEFARASWDLIAMPTSPVATTRAETRAPNCRSLACAYIACFLVATILSLLAPAMWADMIMPMEDNWENWYWKGQPHHRPDFSLHNPPTIFAAEVAAFKALVIPPAYLARAVTDVPTAYGTLWVPPYLEIAGIPPLVMALEHIKWALPLWFAAAVGLYTLVRSAAAVIALRRQRRLTSR